MGSGRRRGIPVARPGQRCPREFHPAGQRHAHGAQGRPADRNRIRRSVGRSDGRGAETEGGDEAGDHFPANTKFNLRTPLVKPCTLSDKQLTAQFGPSCPSRSQIGTGSAVANAAPLASTVNAGLKSYIGKSNQIILVLKPRLPGTATIVIRTTVSGSKLTIPIPRLVFGGLVTVVVVSLKLNVPALGRGRSALITAGRCTVHKFFVKSHFVYADHSTLDLQSSSACF
jgi:hypothetical protein